MSWLLLRLFVSAPYGPSGPRLAFVQAAEFTINQGIMLTYEDGRVDLLNGTDPRCIIAGVGTPSFCTANTDRNGFVDVNDLFTMFGQWGQCN